METVFTSKYFADRLKREINHGNVQTITQAIDYLKSNFHIFEIFKGTTNPLIIKDNNSNYLPPENWTEEVAKEMGINNNDPQYHELKVFFDNYIEKFQREINDKLKSRSLQSEKEHIKNVPSEITKKDWTTTY